PKPAISYDNFASGRSSHCGHELTLARALGQFHTVWNSIKDKPVEDACGPDVTVCLESIIGKVEAIMDRSNESIVALSSCPDANTKKIETLSGELMKTDALLAPAQG
ncbi:hypothetical protein, partial [Gelidibacter salicanalis]|uniref:hypothetical protein n=1 Tax=Gelidibacter salicanalis TaxID=291193 RepID=UPI001F355C84